MTTIAAIQGDGWSVIGYDSRLSRGDSGGRIYTLPKSNGKVVKRERYLIGAAGDLRAINLISDVVKLPDPGELTGAKLDKFFTSTVVPTIRSCFEAAGYGKDGAQESQLIISIAGQLFELGEGYEWSKDTSGLYGIGSGGDYAIGSLHSIVEKNCSLESAKEHIKTAVAVAINLDPSSGGPINIVTQENT